MKRAAGVAAATSGAAAGFSGCSLPKRATTDTGQVSSGAWELLASPGARALRRYDPVLRTRVIDVTTARSGAEARLARTRTQPVSLRNQLLRFWLKVDAASASDLLYVTIKVGSGTVAFENVAYEEILSSGGPPTAPQAYLLSIIKPGQWTPITLGPPSFVGLLDSNLGPVDYEHLQDFVVAVAANEGDETTLSFGGVEVVPGDSRYPHGAVSLTFDDGLSSPYRLGLPILESYGFPATAYVIRDLIGPTSGSYLSVSQLHALQDRGWEIGAHANRLADHNARYGFVGVPTRRLIQDVEDQSRWLRESGFRGAADIALPQGWFDLRVLSVLENYGKFQTIRTVDYRTLETLPVADPHRLRAHLYSHVDEIGPPSKAGTIQWRIDQIAKYGGWVILGFHDMVSSAAPPSAAPVINEGSAIQDTDFARIADYISRRGVPVRTVGEVWASRPGQA